VSPKAASKRCKPRDYLEGRVPSLERIMSTDTNLKRRDHSVRESGGGCLTFEGGALTLMGKWQSGRKILSRKREGWHRKKSREKSGRKSGEKGKEVAWSWVKKKYRASRGPSTRTPGKKLS